MLAEEFFEIPDLTVDPRFCARPLIVGGRAIRFYAGAPLVSSDGHALGTLCVLDSQTRVLSPDQRASLKAIADTVVEQFEARRALLRLFDSSQTELYHVDLTLGRIVFASDAARRNLGYTMEELRSLPLEALLPALEKEGLLAQRLAELRGDPRGQLVLRSQARRKDGSAYSIELRIELIPTKRRELALVVATDLTQREHGPGEHQPALGGDRGRAGPDHHRQARRHPADAATIVYANAAFVRQKAASAGEVIGKRTDTFFGPKTDRSRLVYMREQVMAGKPARVEYVSYRHDGSTYHTEATARPLVDEIGAHDPLRGRAARRHRERPARRAARHAERAPDRDHLDRAHAVRRARAQRAGRVAAVGRARAGRRGRHALRAAPAGRLRGHARPLDRRRLAARRQLRRAGRAQRRVRARRARAARGGAGSRLGRRDGLRARRAARAPLHHRRRLRAGAARASTSRSRRATSSCTASWPRGATRWSSSTRSRTT